MIPYGHQWIDEEDINTVVRTLKSNWITTGPKIPEFEDALCSYIGSKHAIAVNSGTSALDIAVQTLDLPSGSEIITTPFTFVATSNAVLYNNLTPVYADIQKDTRNISPDDIWNKISKKTKAIIYVDYAGHPCDITEITKIADEHDLFLIEDACHALGARYLGKKVGTFADMTIFSFHPVKHITTGEGGAVVTDHNEYALKLQSLRSHGIDKNAFVRSDSQSGWEYDMKYLGRNYRMTDFQAALGISQLQRLDAFIDRRTSIANKYNAAFGGISGLEVPVTKPAMNHAWHIYTILVNKARRNEVFRRLREAGIGVNVHYIPSYSFSYYRERFNINPAQYPITEEVFNRIITLPLYPKMSESETDFVIAATKQVIEGS